MADDNDPADNGIIHYEGGVPIFGNRLDKVEQEQKAAKERDTQYKDNQAATNNRMVLFTCVLALCSIVGAGVSALQARIANRTIEEMKATRQQTKLDNANAILAQQGIAQTSLNASQTSFDKTSRSAENTFRDEQRAWIGINYEGVNQFESGKSVVITISFLNSGKTPARQVKWRSATTLVDVNHPVLIPDADQLISLSKISWQSGPAIAPQAQYALLLGSTDPSDSEERKRSADIVRDKFEKVKSKELLLYDFGELSYVDISGRPHTTTFCVYLADPNTKVVSFCPKFNDVK